MKKIKSWIIVLFVVMLFSYLIFVLIPIFFIDRLMKSSDASYIVKSDNPDPRQKSGQIPPL